MNVNPDKDKVHIVLAHSYSVYFLLFLAGVFLDLIFNLKIFNFPFMMPLGVVLILLATLLIFWAQRTSRNLNKETAEMKGKKILRESLDLKDTR